MAGDAPKFAMADVAGKSATRRRALAAGRIRVGAEALAMIEAGTLPKGDVLALAEVAGVLAAKQTPQLVPLCHPISLSRVAVHTCPRPEDASVEVMALAEITERTGVEMEALTAVSVALLTIWDLVKPVNPALEIHSQRLLYKSGGKKGTWIHPDGLPENASRLLEA